MLHHYRLVVDRFRDLALGKVLLKLAVRNGFDADLGKSALPHPANYVFDYVFPEPS